MNFLRNCPVLLWWIVALVLLIKFPVLVFCLALPLVLASPFHKMIMNRQEVNVLPLSALSKHSALSSMTMFGLIKATIYSNKIPKDKKADTKILDRSSK